MTAMAGRSPTVRGAQTRSRIRDAAMELCGTRGFRGVTVGDIADAAGVYPNQITHHFGSKDALLVEAALALLLRDSERLGSAGRRSSTPESFRRSLARTALALPSTRVAVAAIALAGANPAVQPVLQRGLATLFRQSAAYLAGALDARGWQTSQGADRAVKTFWSAVFGAVLIAEGGFPGEAADVDVAATLSIQKPAGGPRRPD